MTRVKLDLGAAFDKLTGDEYKYRDLLRGLKRAREMYNGDDIGKYPRAVGVLEGTIKSFLYTETLLTVEEIDTATAPLPIEKQGDSSL